MCWSRRTNAIRLPHPVFEQLLQQPIEPATIGRSEYFVLIDNHANFANKHGFGGEGHGVDAVAMHLAAQNNAIGCLALLLDRGANRTIVDGLHGGTPLGWVEFSGATRHRTECSTLQLRY